MGYCQKRQVVYVYRLANIVHLVSVPLPESEELGVGEYFILLLGRSQLYPTFNAPQDVSTPFVGYLCAATSAATYQFSQLEPKLVGSPALVCVSGSNRTASQMDLDFMQCKHRFPDESFAAPSIFLDGVFVPADSRCQETDLSADYSLTHPF